MNEILKKALENKNEEYLIKFLDFKEKKEIDSNQYDLLVKALKGTWHSQHEDLVNTIYLENLKDDRFIEPIMEIALNKEIFRRYDNELEPTLRKCIRVLKTIDSKKSNLALKKLKKLNNKNVNFVL